MTPHLHKVPFDFEVTNPKPLHCGQFLRTNLGSIGIAKYFSFISITKSQVSTSVPLILLSTHSSPTILLAITSLDWENDNTSYKVFLSCVLIYSEKNSRQGVLSCYYFYMINFQPADGKVFLQCWLSECRVEDQEHSRYVHNT